MTANRDRTEEQNMELAQRIQALEDVEAIKRLKHDYLYFCDSKQPDKVRECFVAGPVHIDYGEVGVFDNREALVEVFTQAACHDHMVEMHHAQNPRIDLVDAGSARGVWGLFYHLIDTRRQLVTQLGACYADEYRKVDGRWLISSTICRINSAYTTQLAGPEAQARVVFAGKPLRS